MMNDPTVLEASRVFAQKLVASKKPMEENLKFAFRSIVCLKPSKKQMEILTNYYDTQYALFKSNKLRANETLNVGEFPQVKNADKNESAALMKVISIIYNMEEAISKS